MTPAPTKSYKHTTASSALFFKNTTNYGTVHRALRVEVPEIGKEFTDNAYIGKDPDGIFHYDAVSDMEGSVKAKVLKVVENGTIYVRIKFFTTEESETYAEFIGEDPDDAVDAADMVSYTQNGRDGNWTDINAGAANASIYKKTSESKITITVGSISQKVTLTLASTVNKNFDVDVKGTLHFKKISDLTKGKFASYNNDRIVFYENDYSGKDFVGYFIPFEGSTKTLGIQSANTVIIDSVAWASTS
ncbi:hypothetical protein EDB89DRAFT_1962079 [Lactarius sanguifluus]|nr:hypothetical protein EDB89DRAFT_1962079 [Lactarius sanguifluus]